MQPPVTIADYFAERANSSKVIFELETGKSKTHTEVLESARQIATNQTVNPGQIGTVILPNSITYVEHFLASMMGGWVFNPLPYFTQTQELERILAYIEPTALLTDREDVMSAFSRDNRVIKPVQLLSHSGEYEDKKIEPDQPAALYYSSGTIGNPKGVLYSHKNMVSLISSIVRGFRFLKDDRQLAFLPFGHTASINYNILPALLVGCDLYISQGFEHLRENFFTTLEKYRITYTEIVPTVLFMLNKLKVDISDLDLSNLKFIGCGSSSLPLSAQKEFMAHYGIRVSNLYGLSETGPTHIDDPRKRGWEPGSVGMPLDVNECRISKDGEILIKGDNVFIGYYKNEKLFQQVVVDGWFHTGDLGEERDGRFFFTDRKKDLIIKSGINIVPMEIEEVVHEHPAVLECVAVGKLDKIHGEDIALVAVMNDASDTQILTREIKDLCKSKLSSYKVPNHIYFWEFIPKTPSKKLLRRKVRELINEK